MSPHLINPKQEIPVFSEEEIDSMTRLQTCSHLNGQLTSLIKGFPSYALEDLSKAKLMNRFDTKYLLPLSFLPNMLAQIQSEYLVLEIDGHRIFTYQNTYFDTDNFQFYNMHHNGKLNRFKVRHRKYLETQTDFLEVKFKNNHNKTLKTRLAIHAHTQEMTEEMTHFLQTQLQENFSGLQPKQLVRYQRITLANEQLGERVTVDFCLSFQQKPEKPLYMLDGILVAELKQEHKNIASPFFELMRQHNIRPVSFSKYCIGCCLSYADQLRTNNFKPKLLKLQRYSNINKDYHYV